MVVVAEEEDDMAETEVKVETIRDKVEEFMNSNVVNNITENIFKRSAKQISNSLKRFNI